jgi:hypothetical protein
MVAAPLRACATGLVRDVLAHARAAALLAAVFLVAFAASAQDRIVPRVGAHDTYDRAVLDWSARVDYDVEVAGRDVVIRFARPVDIDTAPIARRLGTRALDLRATLRADGTTLSFALAPGVQLRHFRNDRSIVLDFVRSDSPDAVEPASTRRLEQERAARPPSVPAAAPASAPQPVAAGAGGGGPVSQAQPSPASAAAAAPAQGAALAQTPAAAIPPPPPSVDPPMPRPLVLPPSAIAPPAEIRAAAPPAPSPASAPAPTAEAAASAANAASAAPPAHPAIGPAPARSTGWGPAAAADAAGQGGAAAGAAAAPRPLPVGPPVTAGLTVGPLPPRVAGATPIAIGVAPSAVGYRLRFPVRPLPGVAAFVRGSVIWVVLDNRHALDLGQLEARRREFGPVDAMIIDNPAPATVLRIAPPQRWDVAVSRDGDAWVVEVGARPPSPPRPIEPGIRALPDGSGGRVVVDMPGVQTLLRLRDPDGNDELIAVPTTSAGYAVSAARAFADFRFLPAAQGIVVHPRSERVQARLNGNLFEIFGPQPIIGTDTTVMDGSAATRTQELLDLRAWVRTRNRFDETKQSLHRAVASTPPARRGPERVALAQFLFANGFALEALAQMRFLETEAPRLAGLPASRLLRAASAFLADDIEEAERSLAHPSLSLSNEAALWSGLVKLRLGDFAAASELATRGTEFAERYPPPVGPRVWLAIAEAQLSAGQTDAAMQFLDLAQRQELSEPQRRQLALMRGRVLARQGDVDGAAQTWLPLEGGGPSPTRAEATLARIELMVGAGRMERADAVDTLDRLRFAWRGDRTELRTLILLARMHGEMGNYRAGLQVLRDAAAQFGDAREAREISNEMDILFARLFLEGHADKLPAIQAIALFDEFRDRVPLGSRGDAMVRNLADRLIQVDLLDRAGSLLEHQLRHRTGPADKSDVGAKLALAQLLGNQPDAALATLTATRDAPASNELRRERGRLEARALAGTGRVQDGIARLAGDDTAETNRLRVELLRQARDWPGVASGFARLVGDPPPAGTRLEDDRARDVLHYATALGLAADAAGLKALRERFAAAMDATEYRDLFRVVTAESAERPGELAAVVQRINAVAPFQGFLQSYRKQMTARAAGTPG